MSGLSDLGISTAQGSDLRALARPWLKRMARRNPNTFIECAIRDEAGRPLRQAEVHEEIQDFLTVNRRGVITVPREHGKTIQNIGRTAWHIGNVPTTRGRIICSADDLSVARVKATRELIESDAYRAIFPKIEPGREWTDSRFTVKRSTIVPESTLEGCGVLSKGTGGRSDWLILDDPDDEEVVSSKAKRAKNQSRVLNVWINTLGPDGVCFLFRTPWHKYDLGEVLLKQGWPSFRRAIDDKLTPVWGERWDKARLLERLKEIGSLPFARGFRCRPLEDEDRLIRTDWLRYWKPGDLPQINRTSKAFLLISVDPAISEDPKADYTVIMRGLVDEGGNVYVLDYVRKRLDFPNAWRTIIRVAEKTKRESEPYKRGALKRVGIESVAYQTALAQHIKEQTTAFPTKEIKRVKSKFLRFIRLALVVENGKVFLRGDDTGTAVHHTQKELFDELTALTVAGSIEEHDDTVDALADLVTMAEDFTGYSELGRLHDHNPEDLAD